MAFHTIMPNNSPFHRLTKEFHFRDSDTKCIFVQTALESERSKILKNVTNKEGYEGMPKVLVENHPDGVYVKQYDIHSKYERRPIEGSAEVEPLEEICLAQFVKMYEPFWGKKKQGETEDIGEMLHDPERSDEEDGDEVKLNLLSDHDDKFKHTMMSGMKKGTKMPLPKIFKLEDPYPGEPPFMRLRTKPQVLRFHKKKADKDPEAYWFAESMLYLPYLREEDLLKFINDAKQAGEEAWIEFTQKIADVKGQVMEFLEDNEEARLMAAEMFVNDELTGQNMDPEGEQEQADNQLDGTEQTEEYAHLDPEEYNQPPEGTFPMPFKEIQVRPLAQICEDARKLDSYQRVVLEKAVRYARQLRMAEYGKKPAPANAPLVMVDGAAGAGKSTLIKVIKEMVNLILQQSGDPVDSDCPRVLVCAPTGTAAINVRGEQTLFPPQKFAEFERFLSRSNYSFGTGIQLWK